MKIVCIIVTYNRLEILREVIDAVRCQTMKADSIVILNNDSKDGTTEFLDSLSLPELEVMHLPKNIGGAGGFKRGIAHAYIAGADWAWCMDDDCIPEPEALERLVARISVLEPLGRIGYLASRVEWKDGSLCKMNLPVPHRYWLEPHSLDLAVSRISGCSFVSMLISREAISAVGLPVEEFFIWFDDAEYSRRISVLFPSYLVADSRVLHKTALNLKPLDYAHLDSGSLWKFRCGVRNEMSFQLYGSSLLSGLAFAFRTIRNALKARKWSYLPSIVFALVAGCLLNYRRYISYADGESS